MRVVPLLLLALIGCSATMPSAHAVMTSHVPCTTSRTAPGADGAAAWLGGMVALAGIVTYLGAGTEGEDSDEEGLVKAAGTVLALPGLIAMFGFGASSAHGSRSARACEERSRYR